MIEYNGGWAHFSVKQSVINQPDTRLLQQLGRAKQFGSLTKLW